MESITDLRQTQEYAEYLKQIGWQVERVPDFLYIKKLPLLPWSVAKLQRVKNVNWQLVEKVRKKYRVIKLFTEEMVAKKTIWIDLTKSERELLAEMKPKTRYNIGLAQRRGAKIKIISGREIPETELFNLLKQNARRLKIFSLPKKWFEAQIAAFKNKCFAVLALRLGSGQEDELLAGGFYMTSKDGCFYSHNGSTELGRSLMAPSLCVWEGIREAKRRKLKVFDFEGIYDGSRVLRRWQGFTKFKQGFGGTEISYEV